MSIKAVTDEAIKADLTKTRAMELGAQRGRSVLRACGLTEKQSKALVASLKPRGEFESCMALQLVAAQQMSLHLLSDAATENYEPLKHKQIKYAGDLMQKQAMLLESLHRHRAAMLTESAAEALPCE